MYLYLYLHLDTNTKSRFIELWTDEAQEIMCPEAFSLSLGYGLSIVGRNLHSVL